MKSTVAPRAAYILDHLAFFESRGNYLAYYGHGDSVVPLPATLGDVLQFQSDLVKVRHFASSAVGRYQFMPATLRDLMAAHSISASTPFTPDFQDVLACALLEKRGYSKWTSGALSTEQFADNLSMEWASLPYRTGKSYYDGDGLNHALESRDKFMTALLTASKLSNAAGEASTAPAPPISSPIAQPTGGPSPAVPSAPNPPATKEPAPMTATTHDTSDVNVLAGIGNIFGNVVSSIESSIKVAAAPNTAVTPGAPVPVGSGGTVGAVFGSIQDAQTAVAELNEVIADAKNGRWSEEPGDVIRLLKTLFSILSRWGINVPVVSLIVNALPDMAPVEAPAAPSAK